MFLEMDTSSSVLLSEQQQAAFTEELSRGGWRRLPAAARLAWVEWTRELSPRFAQKDLALCLQFVGKAHFKTFFFFFFCYWISAFFVNVVFR